MNGWICPRCGASNSPAKMQCGCVPATLGVCPTVSPQPTTGMTPWSLPAVIYSSSEGPH